MRHKTSSSRKLSRWMRVSIATVTSTALVAGVAVAAPLIPSFPTTQAAETQSIPANADAYAASTQLDLSAPGLRDLLSTDDPRGVDEILTLLEAEQSWISDSDDEQEPDLSNIELELLELLKLDIGGVEVPLIGPDGLLQGDLGALRAYANAPSDTHAKASVAGLPSIS